MYLMSWAARVLQCRVQAVARSSERAERQSAAWWGLEAAKAFMNQELLVSMLHQGMLNRSRGLVHTVRRTHQRQLCRVVWTGFGRKGRRVLADGVSSSRSKVPVGEPAGGSKIHTWLRCFAAPGEWLISDYLLSKGGGGVRRVRGIAETPKHA